MKVETYPTEPLPLAARQAIARIENAFAASERALVAKVAKALGFPADRQPAKDLGETATRITTWSQVELNAVYERAGGTVTCREVERHTSDGSVTWTALEITVTVNVDGVGAVEVSTDWHEESGGHDLPLMRALDDADKPATVAENYRDHYLPYRYRAA